MYLLLIIGIALYFFLTKTNAGRTMCYNFKIGFYEKSNEEEGKINYKLKKEWFLNGDMGTGYYFPWAVTSDQAEYLHQLGFKPYQDPNHAPEPKIPNSCFVNNDPESGIFYPWAVTEEQRDYLLKKGYRSY